MAKSAGASVRLKPHRKITMPARKMTRLKPWFMRDRTKFITMEPNTTPAQKQTRTRAGIFARSSVKASASAMANRTALPVILAGKISWFTKPMASTHPATRTIRRTALRRIRSQSGGMDLVGVPTAPNCLGNRPHKLPDEFREIRQVGKLSDLPDNGAANHHAISQ